MSTYKKKTLSQGITEEQPTITLPVSYGFTVVREYPGWRTQLIELRGTVATIVEITEPDLKANALYKGERWIEEKTR